MGQSCLLWCAKNGNMFHSHEVAQDADMVTYSFGEEGINRHIVVYKKENVPDEDELNALRRGEEWNEEKAREAAEKVSYIPSFDNVT